MSELRPGDFGYKRKRNIDVSIWTKQNPRKANIVSGIQWDEESVEEDTYLEEGEETIEIQDDSTIEQVRIGDITIDIKKIQVMSKSIDTQKITIYLDKNLVTFLKLLKTKRIIESYSQCIRDALTMYLTEK